MKHIALILCALLLSLEAHSITPEPRTNLTVNAAAFSYKQSPEWQKYKRLRAWGWTALGVGSAMTIVGSLGCAYVIQMGDSDGGPGPLLAMPILGGALTVSSVPLLVRAYKNRRKALAIGATSQTTSLLPSVGKGERQPALALSLYF